MRLRRSESCLSWGLHCAISVLPKFAKVQRCSGFICRKVLLCVLGWCLRGLVDNKLWTLHMAASLELQAGYVSTSPHLPLICSHPLSEPCPPDPSVGLILSFTLCCPELASFSFSSSVLAHRLIFHIVCLPPGKETVGTWFPHPWTHCAKNNACSIIGPQ